MSRRLPAGGGLLTLGAALIAVPSSVGAAGGSWALNGRNGFLVAGTRVACVVQTKTKGSGLVECSRGASSPYAFLFGTGALAVANLKRSGPPLFFRRQPHHYTSPPAGLETGVRTKQPAIVVAPGDRIFVVATDIRCDVLAKPTRVVCSVVSGRARLADSYTASISDREITTSLNRADSLKRVYRLHIG
jgi:hypothetical protein